MNDTSGINESFSRPREHQIGHPIKEHNAQFHPFHERIQNVIDVSSDEMMLAACCCHFHDLHVDDFDARVLAHVQQFVERDGSLFDWRCGHWDILSLEVY
jgi:hypothetical protein